MLTPRSTGTRPRRCEGNIREIVRFKKVGGCGSLCALTREEVAATKILYYIYTCPTSAATNRRVPTHHDIQRFYFFLISANAGHVFVGRWSMGSGPPGNF